MGHWDRGSADRDKSRSLWWSNVHAPRALWLYPPTFVPIDIRPLAIHAIYFPILAPTTRHSRAFLFLLFPSFLSLFELTSPRDLPEDREYFRLFSPLYLLCVNMSTWRKDKRWKDREADYVNLNGSECKFVILKEIV